MQGTISQLVDNCKEAFVTGARQTYPIQELDRQYIIFYLFR